MIKDEVYEKLLSIKGNASFSEVIARLIEESKRAKIARLKKYFGILSKNEAEELEKIARKIRNSFRLRI